MDDLGDGIDEDDISGDLTKSATLQNHGDGVDNRDGVKEGLDEDVPDRGDVAVFDIDSAEEEGDAEGESIELKDERKNEKPVPAWDDAVDKGKDNNYTEVNSEIDKSSSGGGDDDDVFRETNLTKEVAAIDDSLNTLPGAFGEKVPKDGTGHKIDGVMRDIAAHLKEFCEDDVENSKHEKWP